MKNLGVISLISGFIIIITYSIFTIFTEGEVSLFIKLSFSLIIIGIVFIIFNQFKEKQKERTEKNDSLKY